MPDWHYARFQPDLATAPLINFLAMADVHESVTAMASAYAAQAVAAAHKSGVHLDYSEKSLRELESILAAQAPDQGDLTEVCKMWGSYLGEVVRRRFGGEWTIETYPGKPFATLTLNVGGNKIFPSMKIHRRLTQGAEDNVWSFYEMVKARLETKPGGRVQ